MSAVLPQPPICYIYIYTYVHIYIHILIYVYICVHVCTFIFIYVCIHIFVCIHMNFHNARCFVVYERQRVLSPCCHLCVVWEWEYIYLHKCMHTYTYTCICKYVIYTQCYSCTMLRRICALRVLPPRNHLYVIWIYIWIYIHTCTCKYIQMYIYIYMWICIYTHRYPCMMLRRIWAPTSAARLLQHVYYMKIYMYIYIYVYIFIYICM